MDSALRCPSCSKVFKRSLDLQRHIEDVHTDWRDVKLKERAKNYKECPECHHLFTTIVELKHHRVMEHDTIPTVNPSFVCKICQKQFTRKNNYQRHMKRHESTAQCSCDDCGKVFSRIDNLQRHRMIQHGGAQKRSNDDDNEPTPSKRLRSAATGTQSDTMRVASKTSGHLNSAVSQQPQQSDDGTVNLFKIVKIQEKAVKRFNTKGTDYVMRINQSVNVQNLSDILKVLYAIFTQLLQEVLVGADPHDMANIIIQHPELDFPIQLPFLKCRNITSDLILNEIERVLQSYQEFVLDGDMEVHVTHVSMPTGGKSTEKHYVNLDRFLKEKRCIIRIENRDELCCARAIVTAKARIDDHPKWKSIYQGRQIQWALAEGLHEIAKVPRGICGIEEIKKFQEKLSGYQIYVISRDHFNGIIYSGPEAENKIFLYYHQGHYDVITSMEGFFNRSYFCTKCMKGYNDKDGHNCIGTCRLCFNETCTDGDMRVYCDKCNIYFRGDQCYANHLVKKGKVGESVCDRRYSCKECDTLINRKRHKGKPHQCHEKYCKNCKDYVEQNHPCFIKPVGESKSDTSVPQYEIDAFTAIKAGNGENDKNVDCDNDGNDGVTKYIFFDFECMQETGIHVPNMCIAHRTCEHCFGTDVTSKSECSRCGKNEHIFSGENTRVDFCTWLFAEENAGSIVLAHNFRGYDSYFIVRYLYDNAVLPSIIFNGSKVMCINVKTNDMKFIDSYNFLPMALSRLPATFDISELSKGHYPHFYNTLENQNSILDGLPDMKYYGVDSMKAKQRKKFMAWYDTHKHDLFDMQEETLKYCRSDVDILRRCCLEFRDIFMKITGDDKTCQGIDPFKQCITIASACNLVFRTNFLKSNTVAIIPPHGYKPEDKQSIKALQWLSWVACSENVYIKHARNSGEHKVGPYKLDGLLDSGQGEKVALEFQGCYYHGCVKCYARDTKNAVNQKTMESLHQRTIQKNKFLEKSGYRVIEKWECDFDKEVKENDTMRKFISSLDFTTPLEPRDSFTGGRTNATRLLYEVVPGEKIKYVDFTSLYPYVNKYARYPVGHPKIITENFDDISKYEGLVKCTVVPPRGLYHPVLPVRMNGKLLFPLCGTCAETEQNDPCRHHDAERQITGTWVTLEVQKAASKGYRILKLHEIWHFEKTSQYDPETKTGGLFTEYMNTFLKLKQESSSWPHWCESDADKQRYIDDYLAEEGIALDPAKIKKNPGLRQLSKQMANNFWGKFGEAANKTKASYITEPVEFFDLLTSDAIDVEHIYMINDNMMEVKWKNHDEFIEPSNRTNVVIAAYTTCNARLKLYDVLDKLGRRVLYYDTDSVIYISRPGEWDPPLGDFLGQLTNELPRDNHIVSFASGGPKNYAYKLATPDDEGNLTHCKVKGITLNYKNDQLINFDTICQLIKSECSDKITVKDDYVITRDSRDMQIKTKEQTKDYQIVYTKRAIIENYDTLPYGY